MSSGLFEIRAEQMQILEDVALRRWIIRFLRSGYPGLIASMGPGEVYNFVDAAVRASRVRWIYDPASIRKYVHVTFLLGLGFESKLEFAWARKILDDSRFRSDLCRLRVLEDEAIRYLARKESAGARP